MLLRMSWDQGSQGQLPQAGAVISIYTLISHTHTLTRAHSETLLHTHTRATTHTHTHTHTHIWADVHLALASIPDQCWTLHKVTYHLHIKDFTLLHPHATTHTYTHTHTHTHTLN